MVMTIRRVLFYDTAGQHFKTLEQLINEKPQEAYELKPHGILPFSISSHPPNPIPAWTSPQVFSIITIIIIIIITI